MTQGSSRKNALGALRWNRSFVVVAVLPQAIFDVVIEDEIRFFVAEAVVLRRNAVDFIENSLQSLMSLDAPIANDSRVRSEP